MKIGMVGLGRMGSNMVERIMTGGHDCVVFDKNHEAAAQVARRGAAPSHSLSDLVERLPSPAVVWVMVPAGPVTESVIMELSDVLKPGDILVDGGNSFYKDSIRRGARLKEKGIRFVDVGTSGGIWGLERGYCLMYGGGADDVAKLEPIFKALAPEKGYLHCGPVGSGHFVKMVHNGIEYGIMESFAEGFDVLKQASSKEIPEERRFNLDTGAIAEVWRHGSVVSSWLLDLIAKSLGEDPELSRFTGSVADSGEGRWTIEAAMEESVPVNVLTAALFARFRSREAHTLGEKLLSAMRWQFGGHAEVHSNG